MFVELRLAKFQPSNAKGTCSNWGWNEGGGRKKCALSVENWPPWKQ